jgi:succinyl-CoA synthetase beta subunit
MRCDVIDEGIVDDEMEIKMKVKIVWRLKGKKVDDDKVLIE